MCGYIKWCIMVETFMAHLCTHEVYVTIAAEEHSASVTRQDAN